MSSRVCFRVFRASVDKMRLDDDDAPLLESKLSTVTTRPAVAIGYEGQRNEQGQMHGQGRLVFPSGGVYVGSFLRDKRHGQGRLTFANGDVYVGSYVNGLREGEGKYSYADGDVYVGQWKADTKEGYGKLVTATGKVTYEGQWRNNKQRTCASSCVIA